MPADFFTYLVVGLFGAGIGSFLNVCIYRLPRHESIVWPSSRCPACGKKIAPYDNIPLLSFAWLRGRCRSCRARISSRYPLVEALNTLGYLLILWQFGLHWAALAYAALFSALLVITFIDLDHQVIPNVITRPGIALGLLCAVTILPVGLVDSLLGALLGYGLPWAVAMAYRFIRKKEGLGLGDAKLLAMIGAFLGWRATLLTLMVGALSGTLIGLTLIGFKIIKRDQYIPFGPFLAFGAVIAMFWYDEVMAWYMELMNRIIQP